MTKGKAGAETGRSGVGGRAERLAVALKANLKKRKDQARARRHVEDANVPASSTSKSDSKS